MTSSACPVVMLPSDPIPFYSNGQLNFQTHDVGWIICGFFALVATSVSIWLINKHIVNYNNRAQQRLIVRLLFMVPLYSVTTLLSYIFYAHATSIVLFRDSYESILLVSFFYLLLLYLGETVDDRNAVFHTLDNTKWNWLWPFASVRWRPKDGSHFLHLMKWGVLQYCILQPLTSLLAVILNAAGLYCEDSWSPIWGHIYISAIQSISVTLAMYTLLQLYVVLSPLIKQHAPLMKFLAVKSVVFLEFWQGMLLNGLQDINVIKSTQYMTADEINLGVAALLQTFEMVIIAFLHIKAFSYHPYQSESDQTTPRWNSLLHALDFRDLLAEIWFGLKWFAGGGRDRQMDLWKAMGKSRARGGAGLEIWIRVNEEKDVEEMEPALPYLINKVGATTPKHTRNDRGLTASKLSEDDPQPTLPTWVFDELTVPLSSFTARGPISSKYAPLATLDDDAPVSVRSRAQRDLASPVDGRYPILHPPLTRPVLSVRSPVGNGALIQGRQDGNYVASSSGHSMPSSTSLSSLGYPVTPSYGPTRPARLSIPAPLSPARYPYPSTSALSPLVERLPITISPNIPTALEMPMKAEQHNLESRLLGSSQPPFSPSTQNDSASGPQARTFDCHGVFPPFRLAGEKRLLTFERD